MRALSSCEEVETMTRFIKLTFAVITMIALVVVFGTTCIMAVVPDWGLFATAMGGIAVMAVCVLGYNITDLHSKA